MESDAPFTNREIREMVRDTNEAIARVEQQTTRHNGRMTRMEEWRAFQSGAMAVICTLIVPILGWALYVLINIDDRIDEALSSYTIPYEP